MDFFLFNIFGLNFKNPEIQKSKFSLLFCQSIIFKQIDYSEFISNSFNSRNFGFLLGPNFFLHHWNSGILGCLQNNYFVTLRKLHLPGSRNFVFFLISKLFYINGIQGFLDYIKDLFLSPSETRNRILTPLLHWNSRIFGFF